MLRQVYPKTTRSSVLRLIIPLSSSFKLELYSSKTNAGHLKSHPRKQQISKIKLLFSVFHPGLLTQ